MVRPISSLIALPLALLVASCRDEAPAKSAEPKPVAKPTRPALPAPEPVLARAGLLDAVGLAASAAAAGTDDRSVQRPLDGRQFEIAIRFGCEGPATGPEQAALGWTADQEKGALRIWATPTVALSDPLVTALGGEAAEAVEGFWIPRPWLRDAQCPVLRQPAASGEDAASSTPRAQGQRIGIAQYFTEEDPRIGRRKARAYDAVVPIGEGASGVAQGLTLVLSGRLRARNGRVVHCLANDPDRPPDCVVSAEFDRVQVLRPPTGEQIAEWTRGG